MTFTTLPSRRNFLCAGLAAATFTPSYAQDYKSRPLRWLIPYSVGGGSDILARLLSKRLEEKLQQPIVVDNRPGGNTFIAVQALRQAPADGLTFMSASNDTLTIYPHLYQAPYDVSADFTYCALFGTFPYLLICRESLPVKTLQDALVYMRAHDGRFSYSTYGAGSFPHVLMAQLLQREKIQGIAVPYKGAGPAIQDLMGGQIDFMFVDIAAAMSHVQSSKLHAIAVTGSARIQQLPSVPTLLERGAHSAVDNWQGVVMRSGVPSAAVERLQQAFKEVLAMPDVAQQIGSRGVIPTYQDGETFRQTAVRTSQDMALLIKQAGITVN
jgi:tripartite-type tricarboxylate transporter receptor subunit TctC